VTHSQQYINYERAGNLVKTTLIVLQTVSADNKVFV